MTDLRGRHERQSAVHHSKTRAHYRYERQFAPADDFRVRQLAERGLYLNVLERQIARRLVAHEHGYLVNQFAEVL